MTQTRSDAGILTTDAQREILAVALELHDEEESQRAATRAADDAQRAMREAVASLGISSELVDRAAVIVATRKAEDDRRSAVATARLEPRSLGRLVARTIGGCVIATTVVLAGSAALVAHLDRPRRHAKSIDPRPAEMPWVSAPADSYASEPLVVSAERPAPLLEKTLNVIDAGPLRVDLEGRLDYVPGKGLTLGIDLGGTLGALHIDL